MSVEPLHKKRFHIEETFFEGVGAGLLDRQWR